MKTNKESVNLMRDYIRKLYSPEELKNELLAQLGTLKSEKARLRGQLKKVEAERDQWRKQALEEDALNNILNGKRKRK